MFIKEIRVSNRLLQFRTENALTQENLAQALGVTRQTIGAIEKGAYVPSIQLALKIAVFFKKPVEHIFKLEE